MKDMPISRLEQIKKDTFHATEETVELDRKDYEWLFEQAYFVQKQESQNLSSITKPAHYHQNGIDVIGFSELQFDPAELKGFYRINALKYVTRYHKKGTPLQDLQKAKFYIDKLIEMEREEHADHHTGD